MSTNKSRSSDIRKELNAESKRSKNLLQSYKTGTLLTLNIDQIDFYDKNPRITKNEKYDEVYVSIKAKGLEGTLSVSQRPDNDNPDKFLLFRGGNTRLAAQKALYEETKDKKYFEINAIFHEWVSESDTLIGHLTENDSRGDYVFIDRALGVRETKLELEKETKEEISNKGLIRILTEQGYKISKADLIRMNYAVDILYPHCPKLLASGIGPRQLDAIKKLNVKAAELCLDIDPDKKEAFFTQQFGAALEKLEADYILDNEANAYQYQRLYDAVLKILSNEELITANRLEFFLDNRINAKADQQQPFDRNYVSEDDKSIKLEKEKQTASINTNTDDERIDNPADVSSADDLTQSTVDSVTSNADTVEDGPAAEELSSHQESYVDDAGNEFSDSADGLITDSQEPIAAKAPPLFSTNLDYTVSSSPDKHLNVKPWDRERDFDPEFSYFDSMPISVGDTRELAPLPNDISALRKVMYDKAVIFQEYLYIPGKVTYMDDGMGFVLDSLPSVKEWIAHTDEHVGKRPQHFNPLLQFMDKPLHGWWLLLGFSRIMVLAHCNIGFAKVLIPDGPLRDFFSENHHFKAQRKLFMEHNIHFGNTYDFVNHFLARAEPKELQLLIELQLINNKIFNVMKGDIWGLGHKR